METYSKTSIGDKIINGLKKATEELEQFRVQAALGKAEARDAYEAAKKKFNLYLHDAKANMKNAKGVAEEKSTQLKNAFDSLQVQLEKGKAESREIFESQKENILSCLNTIEDLIKNNKVLNVYYAELQMEIEQFKIKLGILKLQYELGKLEAKEDYEHKKVEFSKKLDEIKNRLLRNQMGSEEKWEHFQEEISQAYSHLKKAFS